MTFLQYFGAGLATLGILTVVLSIVSPDQGGTGTIVLGIVGFFIGIAVFVAGGRRSSSPG